MKIIKILTASLILSITCRPLLPMEKALEKTEKFEQKDLNSSIVKEKENVIYGVGLGECLPDDNEDYGEHYGLLNIIGERASINYLYQSNHTSFGQKEEKSELEDLFKEKKKENKKILVSGFSRGAITALTSDCPEATAIFAECPAATLKDCVDFRIKFFGFGWIPFLGRLVHRFGIKFLYPNYDPTGIKPIDSVAKISKDTPVFISCAEGDLITPAYSAAKIAEKLVESGHKQTYFYCHKKGGHGFIIGKKYYNIVNAFLKKFNIIPAEDQKNNDKANQAEDYNDLSIKERHKNAGQELLEKYLVSGKLKEIKQIRKSLEWKNMAFYSIQNAIVLGTVAFTLFLARNKISNFIKPIIERVRPSIYKIFTKTLTPAKQ